MKRTAVVTFGLSLWLMLTMAVPAHAQNIWQELRTEPGLVVLMRHAIAPGGGDPPGFRLGDCRTQRNLSAEGRTQAKQIGRQFRQERVPIAGVLNSRWCRAAQTARLLNLGRPVADLALDSVFTASAQVASNKQKQTERLIIRHRNNPGVLILVGHQANIIDITGIAPASGGAVVVRADAQGRIRVVGQIE
jgi:phosphohistidine phosphatase SixA